MCYAGEQTAFVRLSHPTNERRLQGEIYQCEVKLDGVSCMPEQGWVLVFLDSSRLLQKILLFFFHRPAPTKGRGVVAL